jgi:hypothetical protein
MEINFDEQQRKEQQWFLSGKEHVPITVWLFYQANLPEIFKLTAGILNI